MERVWRSGGATGQGDGMSDAAHPFRLGVLCPMPSELRPVVRHLDLTRGPKQEGRPVHSGTVGDVEITATTTGIGMAAATAAAERLLGSTAIDHLLVVGIAGGVDPSVEIGDVVVPEVVVDDATGIEYRPDGFGGADSRGRLVSSDDLLVDADRAGPAPRARRLGRGHGDRRGSCGLREAALPMVGLPRDQRPGA